MPALTTKGNGRNDNDEGRETNDERRITNDTGRLLYFLLKDYYLFEVSKYFHIFAL